MATITVTQGGWKATIEIENEDGLKFEAYDVVHDQIHVEHGKLSIAYTSGQITEDEFTAKIAILSLLTAATRAALVAALPAIEWEEV